MSSYKEVIKLVESVVQVSEWGPVGPSSIKFRTDEMIELRLLNLVSSAIGHDRINFHFGSDGSPGYSSYTPGSPGSGGWIEIVLSP